MQNEIMVKEGLDLIPVEKINVPELFTDMDKAEWIVAQIGIKARQHEPDLSTATSRKEIASNAYAVSRSKTFLDDAGKEFVDARKAEIKVTDNIRKLIRDKLDAIRDEVRQPLTEWEKAEEERLEAERKQAAFDADRAAALQENDLFDRKREIERKEAEFRAREEERKAKEEAERIEQERIEREKRLQDEAAAKAKAEAEAKAKAEQERIEREKREAEERAAKAERDRIAAEEKAKAEAALAEQRRKEAAEQAERDKLQAIKDAEAKAKRDAEEKEAARLRKEAEERAEAERKARNKAHRRKIDAEAIADFVFHGYDVVVAKSIVELIAKGWIANTFIKY